MSSEKIAQDGFEITPFGYLYTNGEETGHELKCTEQKNDIRGLPGGVCRLK